MENISRRGFFAGLLGAVAVDGGRAVSMKPPLEDGRALCPQSAVDGDESRRVEDNAPYQRRVGDNAPYQLPRWKRGDFEIHFIHTGVGESIFLIFPDSTTMLLDCPGNPAVNLGRAGVPLLPSAKLHAGEWIARYVKRVNPNGADVDYMAVSHFHQDHGGGVSYHKGVAKWSGGEYYRSGFALAAEQLRFRRAIDRTGPGFDDFMKDWSAPGATMKNLEQVYKYLMERDGLVLEKLRVGDSSQIVPLRGGADGFSVSNVCGNGLVAKPDGGIVDLFNGDHECLKANKWFENLLSAGYVFRYGDFSFGTFGDFNGRASDGRHVEKKAAPYMPRVTLAKMNHHGCGATQPLEWVRALDPKAWVSCVWNQGHSDAGTLQKLVDGSSREGGPLICPTVFPGDRHWRAMRDDCAWLGNVDPGSFKGGHVVVTVPPGGKTFTLRYVDAAKEEMRILSEREYPV